MNNTAIFFKDKNGIRNRVDGGGNHFIGAKCINPKEVREPWKKKPRIGDTYQEEVEVIKQFEVTGNIFDDQRSIVYRDHDLNKTIRLTRAENGHIIKKIL